PWRRVHRDQSGRARRHFGTDSGAATDRDFDTRQPLHGREGHAAAIGRACVGAGRGFTCLARSQHRTGGLRPWLGCKLFVPDRHYARHALPEALLRGIDWRAGNLIQYVGAGVLFALGAFAFETREIHWTGELIFAIAWLVLVLSIAAVGLMYWLIRCSAATGFASLFYLVPVVTAIFAYILFGERLDSISILGMVICAAGVALFNRGIARPIKAWSAICPGRARAGSASQARTICHRGAL